EVVEALAAARLDLDVPGAALEAQDALAELDVRARAQPHLAHADVGDEGAIGRVEVAEQKALLRDEDFAVRAADGLVREHQVADEAAADGDLLFGDRELSAGVGP